MTPSTSPMLSNCPRQQDRGSWTIAEALAASGTLQGISATGDCAPDIVPWLRPLHDLRAIVVLALPDSPVKAWFLSVSQCLYHTTRPSRVDEGAVFADLTSMTSGCERQHAWRRTSRARTPRNSISSIVSRLSDSPATGWYCEYIQYYTSKFDHLADLAQDLRAGSIYYQRRDHQLQSAHHLWLRILTEQDYPYGHASSCRRSRSAGRSVAHGPVHPQHPVSPVDAVLPSRSRWRNHGSWCVA
jgi:hypothetical protein